VFLRFDRIARLVGFVALLAVYVSISRNPWLLAEASSVLLAAIVLGAARRPLRRGERARAVSVIAAVSWPALLPPALITPFVQPIMVVAALLPLVLAVPYVDLRRLRLLVAGATSAALAAALLARTSHAGLGGPHLPRWIADAVVLGFLPTVVGLVGLLSAHSRRVLDLSRARVIASTDRARRTVERDLHDGVQQRLLSAAMVLGTASTLADTEPAACRAALDEAQRRLQSAMAELRALCHGVYPAVLTDYGLAAALTALTRPLGPRIALEVGGIGRLPDDVEAAVYFSCAEAVQNITKHAGALAAGTVRCQRDGAGTVHFAVLDDGAGFDPRRSAPGNGLANISERIEAVGGTVAVCSSPGRGVQVVGTVPAAPPPQPQPQPTPPDR
jgi:signal transduction histidine kinase